MKKVIDVVENSEKEARDRNEREREKKLLCNDFKVNSTNVEFYIYENTF